MNTWYNEEFSFQRVSVNGEENVVKKHKIDEPTDKENYRPVSVLPLLLKVKEITLWSTYINTLYYAVFGKLDLDKSGLVGTIRIDLSKGYDCLPHSLFVAKFETHGIDKTGLNLIDNYLSNCKQRTKIILYIVAGMI